LSFYVMYALTVLPFYEHFRSIYGYPLELEWFCNNYFHFFSVFDRVSIEYFLSFFKCLYHIIIQFNFLLTTKPQPSTFRNAWGIVCLHQ
jgi:hypothetical protein